MLLSWFRARPDWDAFSTPATQSVSLDLSFFGSLLLLGFCVLDPKGFKGNWEDPMQMLL